MKRFSFRLQTLLDMKKRKEEEIKRALAEKNGQIAKAQRKMEEIRLELVRFQAAEKKQRGLSPTAQYLRLSVTYRFKLQGDISGVYRKIIALTKESQEIILSLTEAKKESRALEILKEKKYLQWKLEGKREEQEFVDDISQKEYIRKGKTAQVDSF
jgi:flagellar protein FliJ